MLKLKVGTRLLDRLGRKVNPTAAGELLHKHVTLLLEMKETIQLEIESFLIIDDLWDKCYVRLKFSKGANRDG